MEKKLKIAIVCGHFMPEVGYVEVQMAKALSRLGNDVHIFTSNLVSPSVKNKLQTIPNYQLGTQQQNGYSITRFLPYFTMGQMLKCKGLVESITQYAPDLIVIIGLGKLFPKPILKAIFPNAKKIVLLADNEDSFDEFKGLKGISKQIKKYILRKYFKNPMYQLAVNKVDLFYAYTPSAPDVVLNYIPKKLHATFLEKVKPLSLGFDEEEFYFDNNLRQQKRKELNLEEKDVVLITATRITPFKNLEKIIDVVDELNEKGKPIKYIIAGFGTDLYANRLKKYIASKKYATQFSCLPFLSHTELLGLYNAADFGYWPTHIITHYEAMGTGLPIFIPDKKNIQHVIEQGINGWKFKDSDIYDTFSNAITQTNLFREKRKDLADAAKLKFAFTTIASKIL